MKPKTGQTFDCKHCGKPFYRTRYYLNRTPNPLFCGIACRSAAIKAGTFKPGPPDGPRPYRQTGEWLNCVICSKPFYRRPSFISRGIDKTCGASECKSSFFSGANNPFWGKDHTEAVKQALSQHRTAVERKPGPPKGYKHTPEARAKISQAMRQRWLEHREGMLSLHLPKNRPREEQRYRKAFTPLQRKTWMDTKCAWCGTTEKLQLDHIVPVMAGGTNLKGNAQTLCKPCNLWKSVFVDRPFYLAQLAIQSG